MMQEKLMVDWVTMNDKKGALIIVDEGCVFQPYEKDMSYRKYHGDSFSIQQSGVFGALNLHKKFSQENDPDDFARKNRIEIGLENLIDSGHASFFSWESIISISKNWLSNNITIKMSTEDKIVLRSQYNNKIMKAISSYC